MTSLASRNRHVSSLKKPLSNRTRLSQHPWGSKDSVCLKKDWKSVLEVLFPLPESKIHERSCLVEKGNPGLKTRTSVFFRIISNLCAFLIALNSRYMRIAQEGNFLRTSIFLYLWEHLLNWQAGVLRYYRGQTSLNNHVRSAHVEYLWVLVSFDRAYDLITRCFLSSCCQRYKLPVCSQTVSVIFWLTFFQFFYRYSLIMPSGNGFMDVGHFS